MSGGVKLGDYIVRIVALNQSEQGWKISAVRGIRSARVTLGDKLNASLQRSKETADAAQQGAEEGTRVIIGSHDSQDVAREAALAAETDSNGVMRVEVVPNPETAASAAGVNQDSDDVRIYHVNVHADTGEPVGEDNANAVLKDAILVDDVSDMIGDNPFSWQACAAAIVTMATAMGNPGIANTYAGSYKMHTDADLWAEVQIILNTVFPNPEESE